MQKTVIIDRIEEDIAVIELDADNFIDVPVKYLPKDIDEGDSLVLSFEKK